MVLAYHGEPPALMPPNPFKPVTYRNNIPIQVYYCIGIQRLAQLAHCRGPVLITSLLPRSLIEPDYLTATMVIALTTVG